MLGVAIGFICIAKDLDCSKTCLVDIMRGLSRIMKRLVGIARHPSYIVTGVYRIQKGPEYIV